MGSRLLSSSSTCLSSPSLVDVASPAATSSRGQRDPRCWRSCGKKGRIPLTSKTRTRRTRQRATSFPATLTRLHRPKPSADQPTTSPVDRKTAFLREVRSNSRSSARSRRSCSFRVYDRSRRSGSLTRTRGRVPRRVSEESFLYARGPPLDRRRQRIPQDREKEGSECVFVCACCEWLAWKLTERRFLTLRLPSVCLLCRRLRWPTRLSSLSLPTSLSPSLLLLSRIPT